MIKKNRVIILFIFSILLIEKSFAEYRVYQYYVKNKIKNVVNLPSELVTSTLDPKSYVAYSGGRDSIEVKLLRSWLCFGDTSKQPVCTISEGHELEEALK
jgi:predicted PP-loop superfamily ATPase